MFPESAPGTSVAKLKSIRPLFAMFFNVSFDRVNERSPLTDWSGVGLATVTCSVSPPMSSVSAPVDSLSFAFTIRLVRCSVLNPCSAAWREYVSGRTMGKTKRPPSSVTAVSTLPCVPLVIVTVTPGRTPPCESWTDPETDALVVCARRTDG